MKEELAIASGREFIRLSSRGTPTLLQKTFFSLFGAILLALIIAIVLYAPINPDAAGYLGLAQKIRAGRMPYLDFSAGYTPLAFLLFALLDLGGVDLEYYSAYLALTILCEVGSVFLLSLVLTQLTAKSWSPYVFFLLTLTFVLLFDGCYLVLEPYILLAECVALALILLGKRGSPKLFGAGLSLGIAFLFKQHSLLSFPSFMLLAAVYNEPNLNRAVKNICLLMFGTGLPVLVCMLGLAWFGKVPLAQWLLLINPTQYRSEMITPESLSQTLLALAPAILPAALWRQISASRPKLWFVCFCYTLIAFSLLTLAKRSYPHYFILIIPFVFLLFSIGLETKAVSKIEALNKCLGIGISAILLYVISNKSISFASQLISDRPRKQQYQLAAQLSNLIPSGAPTLILGDVALCYLLPITDPSDHLRPFVGCGFYHGLSRIEFEELISASQRVVYDNQGTERSNDLATKLFGSPLGFFNALESRCFIQIGAWKNYRVFAKGCDKDSIHIKQN